MLFTSVYLWLIVLILFFAWCVLISKNPIHAILHLIFLFISLGFLLAVLNLKFLAFILIIVYAGAISILFLFIILTLNLKNIDSSIFFKKAKSSSYFNTILIVKFFISLFLLETLLPVANPFKQIFPFFDFFPTFFLLDLDLFWITNLLYTKHFLLFFTVGLTILITMVGIVLISKRLKK